MVQCGGRRQCGARSGEVKGMVERGVASGKPYLCIWSSNFPSTTDDTSAVHWTQHVLHLTHVLDYKIKICVECSRK